MRWGLSRSAGVRWSLVWLLVASCDGDVRRVPFRGPGAGAGADAGGAGDGLPAAGTVGSEAGGSGGHGANPAGGTGLTEAVGGSIGGGGTRGRAVRSPAGATGGRDILTAGRGGDTAGGAGPAGETGGRAYVGGTGPDGAAGGRDEPPGGASSGGDRASGGSGGAAGTGACGNVVEVAGTQAVYDLQSALDATPSTLDFFDYPWPALARASADVSGFPNPTSAHGCDTGVTDPTLGLLVDAMDPRDYRDYLSELASWYLAGGPNGASVYIRFDGALNPANLPTAIGSLHAQTSTVLLVNLAAATPSRGRLVPVLTRVFENSLYTKPHTLSILPHPGFPLEPGAFYAAVVRRGLGDAAGQQLGSPAAFERMKQTADCAPDTSYLSAFALLESTLGIPRSDVAAMTVFQAGLPTEALDYVLAGIDAVGMPAQLATPEVTGTSADSQGNSIVSGTFDTLIYQYGDPPYLPTIMTGSAPVDFEPYSDNGRFLVDSPPAVAGASNNTVPRTERVEFRLSLPQSAVESSTGLDSVPVVVFATGTGGTIDDPFSSGVAGQLAALGLATFSTTPVMHAARAHSDNVDSQLLASLDLVQPGAGDAFIATVESGDLFFNPLNLQAAKGNSLQAAVDYAWQARVLSDVTLQADVGGTVRSVRFDPNRIYFFGHSQGAATGPLLAGSHVVSALMLSAPSGHLPTNLLGKTKPSDSLSISAMLSYLVCDTEPLDVHHPLLNLLMHWFEEADAQNYAPRMIREAPVGGKHVFVTAGIHDHYVAPGSHDTVTTAARIHQLDPDLVGVPGQDLLEVLEPTGGFGTTHPSAWANVTSPVGAAFTGGFRQYTDGSCTDEHFLYVCDQSTWNDWTAFFATMSPGVPPTVPAQ